MIDLLSEVPVRRIDRKAARQAVVFAFATGAPLLDPLLAGARLADSSFDAPSFDGPLFVDTLCSSVMRIEIDGERYEAHRSHLHSLLVSPPRLAADVAFRRGVLRELSETPRMRVDLEQTYRELRRLFELLETPAVGSFVEQHHHRVQVLTALHKLCDGLHTRFEGATTGLARLRKLGASLTEERRFEPLARLLQYEDHLATVDVRIRVGVDGDVRGFQLQRIDEATQNPFHRSLAGRVWSRFWLWLRGYRFGELQVMARLLDEVFSPYENDIADLVQVTGEMELYLGALGMQDRAAARGLRVCLPDLFEATDQDAQAPRRLTKLFNPLLLDQRAQPIPCDLHSDRADALVLFTGPNSGGKTRLLQAIGLAQLLGQVGLFVPCEEASLMRADGLFVSLSHDITADQEEGRLGMELSRIRDLFERVMPGDLVIFDELCSGTNPSEAEALIRLIMELFAELRPQAFMTTHFLDFAQSLFEAPPCEGMQFMRADIDGKKRPNFGFVPGVAQTSLAAETAARLGVTLEELVSLVARKKASRPRSATRADAEATAKSAAQVEWDPGSLSESDTLTTSGSSARPARVDKGTG